MLSLQKLLWLTFLLFAAESLAYVTFPTTKYSPQPVAVSSSSSSLKPTTTKTSTSTIKTTSTIPAPSPVRPSTSASSLKTSSTLATSSHSATTASRSTPPPISNTATIKPQTSGSIMTSLETAGNPSTQPFATTVPKATTTLATSAVPKSATTTKPVSVSYSAVAPPSSMVNAFNAVDTAPPPAVIPSRGNHPVARLGIAPTNAPLYTNKFYANFFLGTQTAPAFTHPYSLAWSAGGGSLGSWGMAISHALPYQRADGPQQSQIPGDPIQFFINPLGIQSMIMSATELNTTTVLTTSNLGEFSVNVQLSPSNTSSSYIQFPLVQGMAYTTGQYNNLQPAIQSSVFFQNFVYVGPVQSTVYKYKATLNDGTVWNIYMTSNSGRPVLNQVSTTLWTGPKNYTGTIQIAKNPAGSTGDSILDGSAGVYPVSNAVSGSVSGQTGTYTFTWTKAGLTNLPLLTYALPHIMPTFNSATANGILSSMQLGTTTKGTATLVRGDTWTMVEPSLPITMGFAPWSPQRGTTMAYSSKALTAISNALASEINQNMGAQTNQPSMYYAGKAFTKFAQIVFVANNITDQRTVAANGLAQLKTAFAQFTSNQQQFPLCYDVDWKGVVSTASYGGDSGADFGNTYYNDHHFHYGYFLFAAAVIGTLDPSWIPANKAWVNALVRDVANPSDADTYFPKFRSFDWFHGHSWAKGLFESYDSKDEESSSEDVMFAYGMKMWGHTVGDASMEARGNLMLSVLARSLQSYFLMSSSNTVQPSNFIGNKVTGILFENKIDHTTYFGSNLEYIQGIHMLPLIPASTLTRTQQFVTEEWNTYFASGAVDDASNVQGGWKGILYANYAIINPTASFNFFSNSSFNPAWLDGGASQTWYLAYAAGLGGA